MSEGESIGCCLVGFSCVDLLFDHECKNISTNAVVCQQVYRNKLQVYHVGNAYAVNCSVRSDRCDDVFMRDDCAN